MKKRDLLTMFLLMGALEGVYLIYWIVDIQVDIKDNLKKSKCGGGLTIFLIFITLGIYYFIWQWNICKLLKLYGAGDKRVITLILSIFLIGMIINPLIIQSSINSLNGKSRHLLT